MLNVTAVILQYVFSKSVKLYASDTLSEHDYCLANCCNYCSVPFYSYPILNCAFIF